LFQLLPTFDKEVWQCNYDCQVINVTVDSLFKQRNMILFYQFAGKVILVNKMIFLLLCSGAFRAQFLVMVTKLCIAGARGSAVG
jgi:hypothetical protein